MIEAARDGALDAAAVARLIGRLWTLERMFYYIYGGWGQGLEMNDFPPSVKYLFAKQIVDESTHEMLYLDALLAARRRRHPERGVPSALRPVFGRFRPRLLRLFAAQPRDIPASDPHRGAEPRPQDASSSPGWRSLAAATSDADLRAIFDSQAVENRSHINMGRRIVEEFIEKPVEAELCRWACAVARRDYGRFLHELGDFVLDRSTPPPPMPRVMVTD